MNRLPGRGRIERFVQFIVAGGIALVAGLWLVDLHPPQTALWLAGAGLIALGVVGIAVGIYSEIEVPSTG